MASWLKDKGGVISALAGTTAAFVAVLQLFVVGPMNQRFDAMERYVDQRINALTVQMNQRFDAVDQRFNAVDQRFNAVDQRFDDANRRGDDTNQRLDRLTDEVSELRKLTVNIGERVSHNEGQIEVIREQLQTADAP